MRIGSVDIAGQLVLAPMAGVTDAAFRHICALRGAAMTTTEMVSAKALSYGDKKTEALMRLLPEDRPAAVQIFGHEPALMGEMAAKAREVSGCDIIDINMGCPVGKIAANGDGSGLMKKPELARDIIEQAAKNAGCPVTVKFRKGWDGGSVNAVEFAVMCQEAGAAAITVHGRTRVQMYEGRADWDIIRDVKKAVSIPVTANGDVWDAEAAVKILKYTGCDCAMVGRGAFGNPWIFEQGSAALAGKNPPAEPPLAARMQMALEQISLSASLRGERVACLEARRHLCWYMRGVPHSAEYRRLAVHVETLKDVRALAEKIIRERGRGK
ncbi:MAG: tRNA dihydrouridine synthase DusB [Oscillospiraceae bacterium]|nr:tRNA dihydrouridine synthase DusB [Oscillospiraceae bacterium]